jgi:hypothetical protein
MSELIQRSDNAAIARWRLLAGVSALALTGYAVLPNSAAAEDPGRPTVWIEVGAQLERLTDGQDPYSPPFVSALLENPFTPPSEVQRAPRYSFGQEGKLTFAPEGSNWIFSATLRYGRANRSGGSHEETSPSSAKLIQHFPVYSIYNTVLVPVQAERNATTSSEIHTSHFLVDFQVGRDVGLGMFGRTGASTIYAGIRVGQFVSRSKVRIDSDPDFTKAYRTISGLGPYQSAYIKIPNQHWDLYSGKFNAARSFHGIGPSLEWDADVTVIGNPDVGAVTFDWGLNGALLFGRQKVTVNHQTMAHYGSGNHYFVLPTVYPTKVHTTVRTRSVVVPNVGGFAGFSLRFPNAKVSLGYRVDAFFGAMDGGTSTQKTYDRSFYGPFATISIGLP